MSDNRTKNLFDPPGIVRAVDALSELAAQINAEHNQVETALRAGLEHAKRAGEMLIEAKKRCKHGEWLPWLKANVRFTDRTARRYMVIAAQREELANKSDIVSDLNYADPIALLPAPALPTLECGNYYDLPIDAIEIGTRFRKDLGDLEELARSIARCGLIQPIVVRPDCLLAVGHRRLEACRRLGWTTIPAWIQDVNPLIASAIENGLWKNYTPREAVDISLRTQEKR